MDDRAKLSLDLLIGLSIFLVTFIFIAQLLPGVFADVRHEISLANQAYRVATLLVEDPGVYISTSGGGDDWESKTSNELCNNFQFRPGLAEFTAGKTKYNKINLTKVERFGDVMDPATGCRDKVAEALGLVIPVGGGTMQYSFNVTINRIDGNGPCNLNGITLSVGDPIPESGVVVKFSRLVYFGKPASGCPSGSTEIADRCVCRLEVVVWQ